MLTVAVLWLSLYYNKDLSWVLYLATFILDITGIEATSIAVQRFFRRKKELTLDNKTNT